MEVPSEAATNGRINIRITYGLLCYLISVILSLLVVLVVDYKQPCEIPLKQWVCLCACYPELTPTGDCGSLHLEFHDVGDSVGIHVS